MWSSNRQVIRDDSDNDWLHLLLIIRWPYILKLQSDFVSFVGLTFLQSFLMSVYLKYIARKCAVISPYSFSVVIFFTRQFVATT